MRSITVLFLLTGCADIDTAGPIPPDQRPPLESDTGAGDTGDLDETSPDDTDDTDDTEADPIWEEDCHPDLTGWAAGWTTKEEKVVELINEARATPTDCGSQGSFEAADPIAMDPHLQCAGRYHSLWMSDTNSFSHESPGGDLGEDPWARIDSTNFAGAAVGENIAAGYASARDVVDGWLGSDGHCANLMNPDATLTGVGYYKGNGEYTHYWTQNFGR
ncbi:MAG: CAP domain-containing protein [Myxococcota bacterium]|nr:CAP domain-containing protein [Myxococcota bacterium]